MGQDHAGGSKDIVDGIANDPNDRPVQMRLLLLPHRHSRIRVRQILKRSDIDASTDGPL